MNINSGIGTIMNPVKNLPPHRPWLAVFFILLVALLAAATTSVQGAIVQRGTATTGNTTGTSLLIAKPTGVVQGDVMLVNIAQVGNNTTDPLLSGWTVIDSADLAGGTPRYGAVLYKVAGASEPASYTFALGTGVSSAVGDIVAFSGVDTNTPLDAAGTISVQASQVGVVATSITTASSNTAVMMFGMAANSSPTWSGWTTNGAGSLVELYDNQSGSGSGNASVGAAWAIKGAVGATGAGAATLSAAERNGGILVALKVARTNTTTTLSRTVGSSPSTYGTSLTFQATVAGTGGTPTGTVDFKDAGTTIATVALSGGVASLTTNTMSVAGSPHSLTATYNGDASFASSSSSAISQTVNALPVNLSGTRTYDGTTLATAASLAIANNLDGANLTLSGSGLLSSKDVGTRTISAAETPVRVQSATGNTGVNAATTIPVTLSATTAGNTLVAVISTRGTSTGRVSGISGGGTWSRAAESANANGTTTEIWYATNITAGVTSVTITQASLRSAAVVVEYSGILIASPLDQTANTTGNASAASTGTTPTTTQANELWIGGIGLTNSTTTLGTPNNSFTAVTNAASTGTANLNARVYALEMIATSTGTANSGGTLTPTASMWSGAIATFKAELPSGTTLTLGGSAAGNYMLTGLSSAVTNTAKALTVSGLTASNKTYDGTTTATLGGTAALQAAEVPGAGTTSDGKPYTGDTVTLAGSPVGAFADANVGTGKAVTVTGSTLTGAQASNYSVTQQTGLTANITALAAILTGSRTYDGTREAASTDLTVSNIVVGDVVTLTDSGTLSSKDVGSRTITATGTPLRVNTASGAVGSSAATSFAVTVPAPQNGNTLIAVISTRLTSANGVTNISQTGATWTRTAKSVGTNITATEIWYATNLVSAGTTVTIQLTNSVFASAVVMEYQGLFTAAALDQSTTTTNTGTAAVTGTTATTTQANELWIGGIGLTNSTLTLSSILNAFTAITNAASGSTTTSSNANVYALEVITNSTGAASSGGTISASSRWSGAMATFKAVSLGLSGTNAGNYTLTGMTGSLTITAKALTVSGITAANKVYDGTNTATLGGTAALLTAEAAGNGTTSDGKPYTGDTVTLSGTTAGTFADKHIGTAKPVTITGNTISGAQAGNYSLTQQTGLTANITARPITVTATANTKVYDGTTSAAATPAATVQPGDTANFTETYDTKNIGTTKTLTPAGTVTDGNSGTDYTYTFTPVSTGTITAKALTMSGLSVPSSKVYDGTTTAVVSGSPGSLQTAESTGTGTTADGKPYTGNGDGVSLTGTATGTYNSANVASATTVTFGGVSLTGTGSTNYSLTTQSAASAAITQATTASVVASSSNPALPGASVRFTNTLSVVSPGAGTPTGTIQFRTNGAAFGSAVSLSGLIANSLATTTLPHGSNTVTAEYAGDGNFFGITNSLSPSQVINTPPTASNASFVRAPGLSYKIRISDLMTTNTADVDGDTNKLLSFGSSGQGATITTNASFIFYLPSTGASSNNNDSFNYTVKDGFGGTATASISITVVSAVGTAQNLTVSGGSVTVHCAGIPGYPYLIQRSTNLVNWTTLASTNAPSAGLFDFTDTSPPPSSAYYRTAQP